MAAEMKALVWYAKSRHRLLHEETAAKRNQKDRNHLSCKLTANLSDDELEKMSLQTALSKKSDTLARKFGRRRRVLKNRKYGPKCRKRDSEKTDNITEENAALELKILKAKEQLRNAASERDEYKLKYERLKGTLVACHSKGQ